MEHSTVSSLLPENGGMMSAWFRSFCFTQMIEIPLYLIPLAGIPWVRRIFLAALPSLLTHPLLWWLAPWSWGKPALLFFSLAEGVIVLVEGWVLYLLGVKNAWHWALLANATSAGVGLVIRSLCETHQFACFL